MQESILNYGYFVLKKSSFSFWNALKLAAHSWGFTFLLLVVFPYWWDQEPASGKGFFTALAQWAFLALAMVNEHRGFDAKAGHIADSNGIIAQNVIHSLSHAV